MNYSIIDRSIYEFTPEKWEKTADNYFRLLNINSLVTVAIKKIEDPSYFD